MRNFHKPGQPLPPSLPAAALCEGNTMTNRLRQDERDAQPEQQPENQLRRPIVPSWFLDPANDGPREELMVRYRQARNLPEPTQRPIRPPASQHWQPRDWLETQPRPPARSLQNKQSPAPQVSKQPGQRGVRGLTGLFILAAVIAASSGAGFGLVNANFEPLKRNLLAFKVAIDAPAPLVETLETQQQLTTATIFPLLAPCDCRGHLQPG